MQFSDLMKKPVSANLEHGELCAWVMLDTELSVFEQHSCLRKALKLLLIENPAEIHISVYGTSLQKKIFSELVTYVAWLNGVILPIRKSEPTKKTLKKIFLHNYEDGNDFLLQRAVAEGNLLARGLTMLPPNELTPKTYREQIKKLAENEGWKYQEFDFDVLKQMFWVARL